MNAGDVSTSSSQFPLILDYGLGGGADPLSAKTNIV